MFNPMFSPEGLTDKDLNQKILDMSTKISHARAAGMGSDILGNMFAVLHACEEEAYIRHSRKEADSWREADACVFDSDSYLASEEDENRPNESSRKQIYKSGW
jgi:hypothetical protein